MYFTAKRKKWERREMKERRGFLWDEKKWIFKWNGRGGKGKEKWIKNFNVKFKTFCNNITIIIIYCIQKIAYVSLFSYKN